MHSLEKENLVQTSFQFPTGRYNIRKNKTEQILPLTLHFVFTVLRQHHDQYNHGFQTAIKVALALHPFAHPPVCVDYTVVILWVLGIGTARWFVVNSGNCFANFPLMIAPPRHAYAGAGEAAGTPSWFCEWFPFLPPAKQQFVRAKGLGLGGEHAWEGNNGNATPSNLIRHLPTGSECGFAGWLNGTSHTENNQLMDGWKIYFYEQKTKIAWLKLRVCLAIN